MAWIEVRRKKDGSITWWVRDRRDGRQISILAGSTKREADEKMAAYNARRELEKEGYDDGYGTSI